MSIDLVFLASIFASWAVLYGHIASRVRDLERKIERENARVNKLWSVYRQLVDMYYKYRRPDSPEPPEFNDLWRDND